MTGYLNIIKPAGMTSSNVVSRVRYNLKMKKVGHAGTLDPLAVGVLPIMLGKATKMFDYLNLQKKIYITEFTFCIDTDTLDIEGDIIKKSDIIPVQKQIEGTIKKHFLGKISQVPPKVSAISINGKRAYNLARAGVEFEIEPRQVEIFEFDLIRQSGEKSFMFLVECSKGTYIRSLCRDLAEKMNTCAYISYLSREQSGYFKMQQGITLEQLEDIAQKGEIEKHIIKVDEPLDYMDEIHVPIEKQKAILNGVEIKTQDEDVDSLRVYCGGEFIGIGKISQGYLKIKKMFYE
ncbi:MAG: tRNA pseudouridine(55) synthase TruB [Eubacteriales bacterium]